MKAVVLHDAISPDARPDELDTLVQVRQVTQALRKIGHHSSVVPCSLNLQAVAETLAELRPDYVFNLVESLAGQGRLIYLAPALLDSLRIPYTGSATAAMFVSSDKLLAKQILAANGIATPAWFVPPALQAAEAAVGGAYIIKSVWEDASLGLDDEAVLETGDAAVLYNEIMRRADRLGGEAFAEVYIEGREFNLALLAAADGVEILPPAEFRFVGFTDAQPKIVGYRAKWQEDSLEYRTTSPIFDFPDSDKPLLDELQRLARQCWHVLGMSGYARVDFRVDAAGRPWVLEVNANPCLSPDAGFPAAADAETVRAIVTSTGVFSPAEIEVAVELVRERLSRGPASGYEFVFAQQDAGVHGYACYGPIACTVASYDLYWIAVYRDRQGRGLGQLLLSEAERRITQAGGRRIYIETSSRADYLPTRRFYQRCGYRLEATLPDFYSPGDHKEVYVKVLAAGSSAI